MTSAPTPKLSVCVPTYNRADLLRGCLTSILQQTAKDFELIVLDNCSNDETPAVVASFEDRRLRYHRNDQNIGPFPNMNRAIEMARGEYVCIAHDDDIYLPEFLKREAVLLDTYPNVGMVHCAVYETDAARRRRRVVRAYRDTRVLEGRREFVRFLQGHNVCCSSVMVRRRLYEIVGMFDPRFLCADFHLWLRLALHGDIGYVAEPLVEMRVHADTITNWLDPSRWHREFVEIFEEGFAFGAKLDPSLLVLRPALLKGAARAQGKRFLIAAMAAVAHGDFQLARDYVGVLEQLREIGLPATYPLFARLLVNRVGRGVLAVLACGREALARRTLPLPSRNGAAT